MAAVIGTGDEEGVRAEEAGVKEPEEDEGWDDDIYPTRTPSSGESVRVRITVPSFGVHSPEAESEPEPEPKVDMEGGSPRSRLLRETSSYEIFENLLVSPGL